MSSILLIEGKKEEVGKRLKQKFVYDGRFIDTVLNIDPTGYKYVDYIGRKIEDIIPKLTSKVGGLNVQQTEALLDLFGVVIPWFNNNSGKITPDDIWKADTSYRGRIGLNVPNINGIADAPKDINTYEDPEFIKDLMNVIDSKKSEKEKEREIKSQSEKFYEDEDVLVIRPKSHAASCYYGANTKWCTTTKDSPSYFERYFRNGKLYYFINKITGLKNALNVNNENEITVFDSKDNEISLNDLRENFPNQDNLIDDLTGTANLIKSLRKFSKSEITARELEHSDPMITRVRVKEPLGLSTINIEFKNEDQFLKSIGLEEDDIWFAKMIESSYGDYEFFDSYSVEEDFKSGYIIYRLLDDDNLKKLEKISAIIVPEEEFDLENDAFKEILSERLISLFEREMDWIISDYAAEKNNEMTQTARQSVSEEISTMLSDLGFELERSYDVISTTVGNLLMWSIRMQLLRTDILSLFNQIVESHGKSIGGWQDNSYEFQDPENFDLLSFNRTAERNLDSILDKIEEDFSNEEEKSIGNFIKMMNRIKSKFKMKVNYSLPKEKDISFSIKGFDRDDMKILITLRKGLKQINLKLTEDNFYKLLYQKELFDIFGNFQ